MAPPREAIELITGLGEWLRLGLELFGMVAIGAGAVAAVSGMVRARLDAHSVSFTAARLTLARYLVLALEFQLAADVIETAVAPDWTTIGRLAAIGTIRTALNYFLGREMARERAEMRAG